MKQWLIILLTSTVIIFSCSKDEESNAVVNNGSGSCHGAGVITYPATGSYGVNILSLPDSATIVAANHHSFSAALDCSADLKVHIYKVSSGSPWFYNLSSPDGWVVGQYLPDSSQVFQSETFNTAKTLDLDMMFLGPGMARVDFYENSTSVTKSKYFYWQ
jgi:hypothetical protein